MDCSGVTVMTVTAAAVALADGKSVDELNLMGALFMQLGDTLTSIALQRELCENKCRKDKGEPEREVIRILR